MLKEGLLIELTQSQTDFFNHSEDVKALAFCGGFGAGKSFILTLKMIETKLKYPQCDLLYITPVFSNMRDILIPTLNEILIDTNIGYKINKTTGEIFFDVGGRIIVKSADDPSKIIGFNCFAVFFDELDTLPTTKASAVWMKAIARARKAVPKLDSEGNILYDENGDVINVINPLYVATTPEGYRFTYNTFKKKKPDNYRLITASTRENKHLPSDYADNLEAIYPKELVQAYINGEFTNLTAGAVFSEFNRESCDSSEEYRLGETIHVGIDFNVMCVNGVVYVKRETLSDLDKPIKGYAYNNKQTLVAVDHLQKIKDTPELIEVLKNKYPSSKIICYPDASGKNTSTKGFTVSDISMLREAGFQCKYPNKNPAIMSRVLAANSSFKSGLVKINVKRCPDYADALEQQVFNPNTELPEKNSGASIDDITDAGTYIIHYLYPIKRKTFRSLNTKET